MPTEEEYKERALEWYDKLKAREDISQTNKDYFKKYWTYHKGKAKWSTRDIMLRHIGHFLSRCKDLKKTFDDAEYTEKIVADLKGSLSLTVFDKTIAVTQAMVTYLNGKKKPEGWRTVERPSRKETKRKIKSKDMITWQDALKVISITNSVQLKAILMFQLDAGLRPGEFNSLNYGDIERSGRYVYVNIREGKTGANEEGDCILYRCVPYLNRWLELHPTKKDDDPLWVMEYNSLSNRLRDKHTKTKDNPKFKKLKRYSQRAVQQRITRLFEKAEINKKSDFYNLRHSSCTIDKEENIPVEIAAKKHNHSVDFFVNTYGRLSKKQKLDRIKKAAGDKSIKELEDENKPIFCNICQTVNEPKAKLCENCNQPLSLKVALDMDKEKDEKLNAIEEKLSKLAKMEKLLELAEKKGLLK